MLSIVALVIMMPPPRAQMAGKASSTNADVPKYQITLKTKPTAWSSP
jgi:hypothetical protein